MAWTGSGAYVLPVLYSPEVNGTIIDAARYNGLTTDVANGISNCIAKDGQNIPTANLPMGGLRHTGAGAGNTSGNYLVYGQDLAQLKRLVFAGSTTGVSANDIAIDRTGAAGANTLGLGANITLTNSTNGTGAAVQNYASACQFFSLVSGVWTPTARISTTGAILTGNGSITAPAHSYANYPTTGWYYNSTDNTSVYAVNGDRDRIIISTLDDPCTVTINGTASYGKGSGTLSVMASEVTDGTVVLDLRNVFQSRSLQAQKFTNYWALVSNTSDSLKVVMTPNPEQAALVAFANSKNIAVGGGLAVGSQNENTFLGSVRMYNIVSALPPLDIGSGYLFVQGGALKYRGGSGTVTTIAPA